VALTDDQKAMLRLLAQREQGYEDMAALMGLSVDEVRGRVKEALAELESTGAASPPPPPASMAPKADDAAIGPRPAKAPAAARPRQGPVASRPQARRSVPRPRVSLPEGRGALIGLAAGAAVVVLMIVLLATGVLGGGGDSDSETGTSGTASEATSPTATGSAELTQAILRPTDGGEASGRALFGRARKQVVLQVEAEGLDPSPRGESYVVWLARSPRQMLPLAASKVDESGEIAARYPVPTEVLAFLASGSFDEIGITLISDTAFRRSVARARKDQQTPAYTGIEVLRGEITGPIIGVATRNKR
jgi:hypothetical protein